MGFESEKKKLCCSSKINKNESFSDYLLEEERGEEKTLVVMRLDGGDYDGCLKFGSSDSLFPGLYDDVTLNCLAWVCRSDYPSLSCLNKRFNLLMKSGHLYELRKKLEIVENWVYMVCDPRGWEAFDPIKNKWMKLPKIPCDECFNHADKESLTVGSELLVFGRELFEFAIWKYNLIHHTWLKCEEMNCPRCLFGLWGATFSGGWPKEPRRRSYCVEFLVPKIRGQEWDFFLVIDSPSPIHFYILSE